MKNSGPGAVPPGGNGDRAHQLPADTPLPGAGNDVSAAGGGSEFGEVLELSPPPALAVEDIYRFAYAAGFRLALPEDPSIESLVEVRRHLGSYLEAPELDAFERLGEATGQWWAAFRRGWGDRRKGRDADPTYHGKGPR